MRSEHLHLFRNEFTYNYDQKKIEYDWLVAPKIVVKAQFEEGKIIRKLNEEFKVDVHKTTLLDYLNKLKQPLNEVEFSETYSYIENENKFNLVAVAKEMIVSNRLDFTLNLKSRNNLLFKLLPLREFMLFEKSRKSFPFFNDSKISFTKYEVNKNGPVENYDEKLISAL